MSSNPSSGAENYKLQIKESAAKEIESLGTKKGPREDRGSDQRIGNGSAAQVDRKNLRAKRTSTAYDRAIIASCIRSMIATESSSLQRSATVRGLPIKGLAKLA